MPDHILCVEVNEADAADALEDFRGSTRPLVLPDGRSIWVTSPVTTALEPNPMRVRNIFICSDVVF